MKYNPLLKQGFESLGTTGALGVGRVLFIQNNSSAATNSNLFWNNTLNRLGIGTDNPTYNLDIASNSNPGFNLSSSGSGGRTYTVFSTDATAGTIGPGFFTIFDQTNTRHLLSMSGDVTNMRADTYNLLRTTAGSLNLTLTGSGTGFGSYSLIVTNNTASIGGNKFSIFSVNASLHRFTIDSSGFTGIGVTSPSSRLDVAGDIEIPLANFYYFGDPNTNGSVRMSVSGDKFLIQRRQSGNWVTKRTFSIL